MLDSYLYIATHPLIWILLGLTAVFFVVQWLVGHPLASPTAPDERIKRLAERVGMKGLQPVLFLMLLLTWGLVAATLFVGLYAILWQVVFHPPPEGAENVWDWRFTLAQLVALTTVLGAVIALPITINRLILTRRQTDTVEQGHITDRINKAVEGLGATKLTKTLFETPRYKKKAEEWIRDEEGNPIPARRPDGQDIIDREVVEISEPNLEVRIGAIYALERIAQDSDRDHVQIMEILCAYIRQNAPPPETDDLQEMGREDRDNCGVLEMDWVERLRSFDEKQAAVRDTLKPREDIQVALKVLGRRSRKQRQIEADKGHTLDPRSCDLRCMDLSDLNFSKARFDGANLNWTRFKHSNLTEAVLWNASLRDAFLGKTVLAGASLGPARLEGADLGDVNMRGIFLGEVHVDVSSFFANAELEGAAIRDSDLTAAPQLVPHLDVIFGDHSVSLADDAVRPRHWPNEQLSANEFIAKWRKWQTDRDTYSPPDPPDVAG